MLDLNKHNIKNLFDAFSVIEENERVNLYKLATLQITKEDKEVIQKSIDLRKTINEVRGVNSIEKFQRSNPAQVDLKAIIGEYMFSKLLLNIFNNKRMYNYEITVPAIAEMILNRKKQDFEIIQYYDTRKDEVLDYRTFDIKSQFVNNSFNYLTVNIKSFEEMKKKSNWFIVCLIDGEQDNFNTNNNVTFYFVKNNWFENNSVEVLQSNNPRFTPYRKLEIKKIYH